MRDLKHATRRPTRVVKPVGVNRVKQAKKERKPLNIRRHLKRAGKFFGGVALVALLGFAGYHAYHLVSRIILFKLDTIEVTRNRRIDRREIIALANIRVGDDLIKLNLKWIGEQLEKNPWIEEVRVKRYFPHTLAIEVVEREPVAVINVGYLAYLDTKGVVFKPLNEGDSLNYPIITGITEDDCTRDPTGTKRALSETVGLIALLKQGQLFRLDDVSELHYDKGFGFTLFTTQGGIPVRLGADGYPEKLARLARIYRELQPQLLTLEYIDLNYSDKIIVKKVIG
jgi:cell division protein FtsQ